MSEDHGGPDFAGEARFRYMGKASTADRNFGLPAGERNFHATVKPVELMKWLVKLITPPGGRVLDPFCGSGSTGVAAIIEGFDFIGIDQNADYLERLARPRCVAATEVAKGWGVQGEDTLFGGLTG